MSWLTSTISRVRIGAQLGLAADSHDTSGFGAFRGQVQAASAEHCRGAESLERRVREVLAAAAEASAAHASSGVAAAAGPGSAACTASIAAVEDLMRSWVRKLEDCARAMSDGLVGLGPSLASTAGGGAGVGFRVELLRSSALELLLQGIAGDNVLRKHFSQPHTWTSFGLRGLLRHTLDCAEDVWAVVLRLAFGDADLVSETLVQTLVKAVSLVKADWRFESHQAERQHHARRTEQLLRDSRQAAPQGDILDPVRLGARVRQSRDLLAAYEAIGRSLQKAYEDELEGGSRREEEFKRLDEELQAYVERLADPANGLDERNKQLQRDLQNSSDDLQSELQRVEVERGSMDRRIEELESTKRDLRCQLDNIAIELKQTQVDQLRHMQQCDGKHAALNAIELEYRAKLKAEAELIREAQKERSCIERALEAILNIDAVLDQAVNGQIEDLLRKQSSFEQHFVDVIRDHVAFEEQHLSALQLEAEQCARFVGQHRAQIELLTSMDMSTSRVVAPEERRRLERLVDAADAALAEHRSFQETYGKFLEGTSAEALAQIMEERHYVLQQVVAPCRDLIPTRRPPPSCRASEVPEFVCPAPSALSPPVLEKRERDRTPIGRYSGASTPPMATTPRGGAQTTPRSTCGIPAVGPLCAGSARAARDPTPPRSSTEVPPRPATPPPPWLSVTHPTGPIVDSIAPGAPVVDAEASPPFARAVDQAVPKLAALGGRVPNPAATVVKSPSPTSKPPSPTSKPPSPSSKPPSPTSKAPSPTVAIPRPAPAPPARKHPSNGHAFGNSAPCVGVKNDTAPSIAHKPASGSVEHTVAVGQPAVVDRQAPVVTLQGAGPATLRALVMSGANMSGPMRSNPGAPLHTVPGVPSTISAGETRLEAAATPAGASASAASCASLACDIGAADVVVGGGDAFVPYCVQEDDADPGV